MGLPSRAFAGQTKPDRLRRSSNMAKQQSSYAAAGVDIDRMSDALKAAGRMIHATRTPGVVSEQGSFGGLFSVQGRGLLVSSIDGVGTKLKVAAMARRHDTVGQDLVNHCVNDILVQGAKPLFFMDYIGAAQLEPKPFADVVRGLCKACRQNECALIGGETAEMPGLYPKSEYDLVGAIVGWVDSSRLVTGHTVRRGDVLIGLPSTGLHTNGYSLARHIVFKKAKLRLQDTWPGTRRSVEQTLLAVHRSYLKPVQALMDVCPVRAMAHITGGGLIDNVPRVLPDGLGAAIDPQSWKPSPVFGFLQEKGRVDPLEMYRVFNMGIGFVVIVRAEDAARAVDVLKQRRAGPKVIGYVENGRGVRLM